MSMPQIVKSYFSYIVSFFILKVWYNYFNDFFLGEVIMEEKFDVLNEFGEFTGEIATREECHKKGLWHRAVYAFIIDDKGNILLQKRSNKKSYGLICGM